jgi:hypothetical protein
VLIIFEVVISLVGCYIAGYANGRCRVADIQQDQRYDCPTCNPPPGPGTWWRLTEVPNAPWNPYQPYEPQGIHEPLVETHHFHKGAGFVETVTDPK